MVNEKSMRICCDACTGDIRNLRVRTECPRPKLKVHEQSKKHGGEDSVQGKNGDLKFSSNSQSTYALRQQTGSESDPSCRKHLVCQPWSKTAGNESRDKHRQNSQN